METLISLISGYAFWVVISRIVTPDTIGVASALISFSYIVTTIAAVGIPSGIQRFLGISFSSQKINLARTYARTSLVWISLGIAVSSITIFAIHDWIGEAFHIDLNLIIVVILLIATSCITTLFRAIIISSLKTRILAIAAAISLIVKFMSAIILIAIGFGAAGIALGFTFSSVIASIFFMVVLVFIFKSKEDNKKITNFKESSKEILSASSASWIPAMIYTLGAHLGPVLVFGSLGAGEAGIYYMAFAVALAISSVMQVLFTIAYPVLSGMQDGRKRFIWQATKMSLIISLPISSTLIFYSNDIMALFGEAYKGASLSLAILMSSMLPIAVATSVSTLAYSYGNYRQVLAIGLASNVPRAMLYIFLLPIYGSEGAAIAYAVGSIIGLVASIIIAHTIQMRILWREVCLLMLIPSGIAFLLSQIGLNYIFGIALTLSLSYLLVVRLGLLTRVELQYLVELLPDGISSRLLGVRKYIDRHRKQYRDL